MEKFPNISFSFAPMPLGFFRRWRFYPKNRHYFILCLVIPPKWPEQKWESACRKLRSLPVSGRHLCCGILPCMPKFWVRFSTSTISRFGWSTRDGRAALVVWVSAFLLMLLGRSFGPFRRDKLERVKTVKDPLFEFDVPESIPNVPTTFLNPRKTWSDTDAYDTKGRELVASFREQMRKFEEC